MVRKLIMLLVLASASVPALTENPAVVPSAPEVGFPVAKGTQSELLAGSGNDANLDLAVTDYLSQEVSILLHPTSPFIRGDANGDGKVTVADVVYLISYWFKSGPAPNPLESGDVNCHGQVNPGDIMYLVNYLFKHGPPPCM